MFKRRRSKTQSTTNSNGSAMGGAGGGSASNSDGASANSSLPSTPIGLRSCLRQQPDTEGPQEEKLQSSDSRSSSGGNGGGSLGTPTTESGESGQKGPAAEDTRSSNRTSTTSSSRAELRRRVNFRNVIVREFERVIGDNPSCSSGAPVAIGWAFGRDRVMNLEEFEQARPIRRTQHELILTRQDREEILIEWGATFNEIIDSIRANVKAKNQRRRTVNAIGTYDRWEEAMESAGRRLKRTLLLQKTTKRQVQDLQRQSERCAKAHGVTRPGAPSHPKEIATPSPDLLVDDVELLSLPEYYVERSCDQSSTDNLKHGSSASLQHSLGRRGSSAASHLTNSSPEIVEPDAEAGTELENLGVDEDKLLHQEHYLHRQVIQHPHPIDHLTAMRRHPYVMTHPYPQQQNVDPQLLLPCEGPVLEVGFSRDQVLMLENEDDLSTWCLTLDDYQQEYNYAPGGAWDMTNSTTIEENDSMMGAPALHQNNAVPVIISEDGQYDIFEYNGFTVQPPPYSNRIIDKWE